MAVLATRGTLWVGAITAINGDGGTELGDIQAELVSIDIRRRSRTFKTGLSPDQYKTFYRGSLPPIIRLMLRDVAADDINLLFTELAVSGAVKGSGASINGAGQPASTRGVLLIPNETSNNYFYAPNASLSPSQPDISIHYSPEMSMFEEAELHLTPNKAAGNSEPAWMFDTSANIVSAYSGLS